MKAKIISNLSGSAADGDHFEPHGTLQHVAHIPRPGVICQLKLGASGLQYCRAGVMTHVIPREQLIALFEKLEPKFAELPLNASGAAANTRPKEVDELGAPIKLVEPR
jgi:hypothetical protein